MQTNTKTTEEPPIDQQPEATGLPKPAKRRVWCVVRLRDYCLNGLHQTHEGDLDFERIKATLMLYTDREQAFQAARDSGGLLCAAESLPRATAAAELQTKIERLAGHE